MLSSCKKCHRQYDVEGMKEGQQVRCRCGELFAVPAPRVREARTLHCSGCGGKLREKAQKCDYCAAEITLAERNMGPACPECFARLPSGAKFCSDCGVEIRPEAMRATRASASCPRCKGSLTLCELEKMHYTECGSCGGLWLDAATFDRVISERDTAALDSSLHPLTGNRKLEVEAQLVKYLSCPVCDVLMHRKNFGNSSGVVIDWCKGHGFWFDVSELEKIIVFINSGGLDKMRQQEIQKAKDELDRLKEHKKRIPFSPPRPFDHNAGVGVDLEDVLDGIGKIGSFLWRLVK